MRFETPLLKGTLTKRYKRFLADIVLENGQEITAHCMNSGSMLGVNAPGSPVWVSPVDNPTAKLDYRWELIQCGETLVGINTGRPNALVEEALKSGKIKELQSFTQIKREVKFGNSRFDFHLIDPTTDQECYLEVKNVTLERDGQAQFPDAVTTRGQKHVNELVKVYEAGHRAVMLYVVQREDCNSYHVAEDIDPGYAEAVKNACKKGVEFLCYRCVLSTDEIVVDQPLPIEMT